MNGQRAHEDPRAVGLPDPAGGEGDHRVASGVQVPLGPDFVVALPIAGTTLAASIPASASESVTGEATRTLPLLTAKPPRTRARPNK